MDYIDFVGIDVSKSTLDVALHKVGSHEVFSNDAEGYEALINWLLSHDQPLTDVLICLEHTGIYSEALSHYLQEIQACFVLVSGLDVKRSLGIRRGKTDSIDARRLAEYIYKNHERIERRAPLDLQTLLLKKLLATRNLMVKHRAAYKQMIREKKRILHDSRFNTVVDYQEELRDILTDKIKQIDKQIKRVVQSTPKIKKNMELACSVPGVGPQTALSLIISTHNFTRFATWRKVACHIGIAPFPHRSGTSVSGKTRVSHQADKKLKSLFNTAALSAIRCSPELKRYYHRRVAEGKHKMSVKNIIRNKLLARVFATVNRQTPYVEITKF